MIAAAALAVVIAAGVYLIVLGLVCLIAPAKASRFLSSFAHSPRWHLTELLTRLVVGGAFILAAPRAATPGAFSAAGWVLIVTTFGLLLLPWRWHRRIAAGTVPRVLRALPWLGIGSLALGGTVIAAVVLGTAP